MPSDKKHEIICCRVARIFREEREKRGLSMNAVAERAGLSQQMVSYVEREIRNPTLATMLRISSAIGIELADVIREASKGSKMSK